MRTALVIGGGLGGLFTGAILSKEGFKVTVVEKNITIGGGLQNFMRFGLKLTPECISSEECSLEVTSIASVSI